MPSKEPQPDFHGCSNTPALQQGLCLSGNMGAEHPLASPRSLRQVFCRCLHSKWSVLLFEKLADTSTMSPTTSRIKN